MATIPIFAPTADYQVGGLQGFTAPTAEPMKDATGAQIAQRGDALGKIGTTAIVMASRMELEAQRTQDVLDETEVAHAINGFSSFAGKNLYGDKGFMMAKGMDANPDALNGATMTLTEERDRLRTGLSTPHSQKLFDLKAEGMMSTLGTEMTKHASVETKLAHTAEGMASVQSLLQLALPNAGEWGNPDSSFNQFYLAGIQQVRQTLVESGAGEQVVKDKTLDLTTKFNSAVILQFLAQGTQAGAEQAQAYLVAHEKQIDWTAAPGLKDRVHRTLMAAEVNVVGFKAMKEALAYEVPGHTASEILDEERRDGHLTQEQFDNAMGRLEHVKAQDKQRVLATEQANLKAAYTWIDQHPGATFEQIPANLLAETTGFHNGIKQYLVGSHRQESDQAQLYHLNRMAMDRPEAFQAMNLLKVKHLLSTGDFHQLTLLQASITKGDPEIKEVTDAFKSTLSVMKYALLGEGFDLTPKEGSSAAKTMEKFTNTLLSTFSEMQKTHTLPKTVEEQKKLGMQLLHNAFNQTGGLFSAKKKVFELYESSMGQGFEIPPEAIGSIRYQLRQNPRSSTWSQAEENAAALALYRDGLVKGRY